MSFLNKINVPLINSKITAIGRQKIAEGALNFKYFAFGDSQIDYHNLSGSQNILKPKDKNPNIKTFITKADCLPFYELSGIKVLECCVHNRAKERGFFDENNNYALKLDGKYVTSSGTVLSQQINGTRNITLPNTNFNDGDFILFKINNPVTGYLSGSETEIPVPYLFFKISKNPTSKILELDRNMPFLNFQDISINYYIFSKDLADYKSSNANVLWDYEDLNFQIECLEEDTYIWNFNVVWGENVIGTQDNQQQFTDYCSYNFIGQKEYLGYNLDCCYTTASANCDDKLLAVDDTYVKAIGIIHYTNTNKSNLYGEHFYIANNNDFKLHLETLMWHRRFFTGGTATGDELGMTFVVDTEKKYVPNTNIAYYDMIEDPTLISSSTTAMVVGRVYADLHIATVHHPELLAAMMLKSNRNFSLPKLAGKMISPSNPSNAVLPKGKTLFLTYTFEADNGILHILPQQQYIKYVNNTSYGKDIEFNLEDVNLLPYMRQKEAANYDGLGFSFHRFKIVYQIVDNGQRPVSDAWKTIDYTNNFITDLVGNTINPLKLEVQNSAQTGFIINDFKLSLSQDFNISILNVPDEFCPDVMGFGCEQFLFGNIDVEIGACLYKTIFELTLDSDVFVNSTNPTWNKNQNLKLCEIGIYDDKYNLVLFSSLFEQIDIVENTESLIEIQMDF